MTINFNFKIRIDILYWLWYSKVCSTYSTENEHWIVDSYSPDSLKVQSGDKLTEKTMSLQDSFSALWCRFYKCPLKGWTPLEVAP